MGTLLSLSQECHPFLPSSLSHDLVVSPIYTDLRIKELLENQRTEKEIKSIKKDAGKF